MPSVLWQWYCWLGGRKGIWPAKNWLVGSWYGYLTVSRCRFAYGPADPTATDCLLLQEIQIGFGFIFLLLAHLVSPRQNPESCKTVVVVLVVSFNCRFCFCCSVFITQLQSCHHLSVCSCVCLSNAKQKAASFVILRTLFEYFSPNVERISVWNLFCPSWQIKGVHMAVS